MDIPTIIASVASAVIIAALAAIWQKITKVLEDVEATKDGTKRSLLSDIDRIHDGAMKNGKISDATQRIFFECYQAYKELGGDGYADSMKEDIKRLLELEK